MDIAKRLKTKLNAIITNMSKEAQLYGTEGGNDFTRKRKWPFSRIIHFILSFGSQSLGTEIAEYFKYAKGFPTVSAFVQQRNKLSSSAMEHLYQTFTKTAEQRVRLYKKYRLLAIDGSDLSLPYNPQEDNVSGENHLSTLHLNGLYDVINKACLDVVIQKGTEKNETGAACQLVDRISDKYPVIVLADRGYESYNLFAHIEERSFDYVIRIRGSNSIASGMGLPTSAEYDITKNIIITRHSTGPTMVNREKYKYFSKGSRFDFIENSKCPDYEMTIRFVRFELSNGQYELLATSLPPELFSVSDLKDLYHLRWGVEIGFREMKYIMGLSAFHSKKENSIIQEIYARLIMYNFSMFIILFSRKKEIDPRNCSQVNFTQAVRVCLYFFRLTDTSPPFEVEATIDRFLLPVRPCRKFPRVRKSDSVVPFNYRLS